MTLTREILALRRRGSELSNKWRALGFTLVGPDGETLARFTRPELAELTARVHNLWLTLSNQWLLSVRAQRDRTAMATTEKEDEWAVLTPTIPPTPPTMTAGSLQNRRQATGLTMKKAGFRGSAKSSASEPATSGRTGACADTSRR